MTEKRTLVIGWFTFEWMGATAGDYIAADILCGWLREAGIAYDVAVFEPIERGQIATESVVPTDYRAVVFVCGPIGDAPPLSDFLGRFPHAQKFAANVSLLQERSEWNPFVHVVERDSRQRTCPDLTFAAAPAAAPVVGIIYLDHQPEYSGVMHEEVERVVREVLARRDIATVQIDTQLDPANRHGLRTPAQVESVIAKMDAVITTRLHGAALAIRRGVPAVVIDSVRGGAKLTRQMKRIEWPLALEVGALDAGAFERALDFALTAEARELALQCARRAARDVEQVKQEFMREFQRAREGERVC
ncbi:MAG: hypothetical protein JWN40_4143 [Phycisphaerales bacterium]|nr:hypothetical protein [Phycisphaerales bacterium]